MVAVCTQLARPVEQSGDGRHLFTSLFRPDAAMKLHISQVPNLLGWGASLSVIRGALLMKRLPAPILNWPNIQPAKPKLCSNSLISIMTQPRAALKLCSTRDRDEALRLADMLADKGLAMRN